MSEVVNIKVIGVGGAGNNVVSRMMLSGLDGITCININTDKPTLTASSADERLQIGERITHGQGAGSKPEIGKQAAEEDRNAIAKLLEGTDALFLTAGMGGGTGTGAIPVVADIASEMGILTIAVVSTPFRWEGARKMRTAEQGLEELKRKVDTLFIIPNENIRKVSDTKISFADAFSVSDDILNRAVTGIVDLLRSTGFINLDFADLKAILRKSGVAHLGIAEAAGKDKVSSAADQVISSELTGTGVHNAKRIIANLTVSPELEMDEVTGVMERVQEVADPDVNIIFGLGYDEGLTDALRMIVIATDFSEDADRLGIEEPKIPPRGRVQEQPRPQIQPRPEERRQPEPEPEAEPEYVEPEVAEEEPAPEPEPEPAPTPVPAPTPIPTSRKERRLRADDNWEGWFEKYFGKND